MGGHLWPISTGHVRGHPPVENAVRVLCPLLAEHDQLLPVVPRPLHEDLDQPVINLLVLLQGQLGILAGGRGRLGLDVAGGGGGGGGGGGAAAAALWPGLGCGVGVWVGRGHRDTVRWVWVWVTAGCATIGNYRCDCMAVW